MKYVVFIITLGLHFLVTMTLKLLDNPSIIIGTLILATTTGYFLKAARKKETTTAMHQIGWGIFYGSLTSLTIIIGLFAFLS